MVMIMCVSPTPQHFNNTHSTFIYVEWATRIKRKVVKRNVHISQYIKVIPWLPVWSQNTPNSIAQLWCHWSMVVPSLHESCNHGFFHSIQLTDSSKPMFKGSCPILAPTVEQGLIPQNTYFILHAVGEAEFPLQMSQWIILGKWQLRCSMKRVWEGNPGLDARWDSQGHVRQPSSTGGYASYKTLVWGKSTCISWSQLVVTSMNGDWLGEQCHGGGTPSHTGSSKLYLPTKDPVFFFFWNYALNVQLAVKCTDFNSNRLWCWLWLDTGP